MLKTVRIFDINSKMPLNIITPGEMPMLERQGKIVGKLQEMTEGAVNMICPICGGDNWTNYGRKPMFAENVDWTSLCSYPKPGSRGNVLLVMVCNEDGVPFVNQNATVEEKLFRMNIRVASMMEHIGVNKWPYSNIIMITSKKMDSFSLLQAWEMELGSKLTEMSPDKAPF